MDTQTFGSIVAMEFRRAPKVDFADIVEEFDIALQTVDSQKRALTWDSDDIALIDRDYVRVALGWQSTEEKGRPSHLIVAVGAPPDAGTHSVDSGSYRLLAELIAERTRGYLPYSALLRGDAHQPVGSDLIDSTFDLLRPDTSGMAGDTQARDRTTQVYHGDSDSDREAYEDIVASMSPPWAAAPGAAPGGRNADAGQTDKTGAGGEPGAHFVNDLGQMLLTKAEPTQPLRLTIHTLALSLCLYVPALGAAMFTYTMLRDLSSMAT